MIPCSSGNSPTMEVSRSHLASSAARTARSLSLSISSAISPASVATRRTLSPIEPSLAWKVTASSAPRRSASGCLRSWLQKNAASLRRAHHAFVARLHPGRIEAADIAHRDEMCEQLAIARFDREIPLMLLQRGDQHLAGQLQESRLEIAGDRIRPLHQRRHFVEQLGIDQR